MSDPLTHMVRNAVDHGIESPEERVARGKSRQGIVTHRRPARSRPGGGGDRRRRPGHRPGAHRQGGSGQRADHAPKNCRPCPRRTRCALIFLPGLSTAEKVSDVSGRGVGMDVVKTNLDRLGGKMEIIRHPARAPLSASSCRSLWPSSRR